MNYYLRKLFNPKGYDDHVVVRGLEETGEYLCADLIAH